MGDAEYMIANGLDPFMRYVPGNGVQEWDNPLYRDEGPSSSYQSKRSYKFNRTDHLDTTTVYYRDGVAYRWTGYHSVPREGDVYLYDADIINPVVAFGAGNAVNEWPVLEEL